MPLSESPYTHRPVANRRTCLHGSLAFAVLASTTIARAEPRLPDGLCGHAAAASLRLQAARILFDGKRPKPDPPMPPGTPAWDFLDVAYDVTIDPATKVASNVVAVSVRANTNASSLGMFLDEGIGVVSVSAPGHVVTSSEQIVAGYNYVTLSISPPVAKDAEMALALEVGGELACAPGFGPCGVDASIKHFLDGSIFPYWVDPLEPMASDVLSTSIVMRVPAQYDVVASAALVETTTDGQTTTTTWQSPQVLLTMTVGVVLGDFTTLLVPGLVPDTTVVHDAATPEWAPDMVAWTASVLPFMTEMAGQPLPFGVATIKLPVIDGFPGTATNGMTFLADSYAALGPEGFEEILAHEHSHLWWGVTIYPSDPTFWLVEGLATHAQMHYTAAHHHAAEDLEAYLGVRHRWQAHGLRYLTDPATLPDLQLADWQSAPSGQPDYTVWAYFKGSAVLEHLRTIVGDAAFLEAIDAWVAACSYAACTSEDFRAHVEAASGKDLGGFFDAFVYSTHYPRLAVGFEPSESGAVVRLEHDQPIDVELELVLELANGNVERKLVTVPPGPFETSFDLGAPARVVKPNARHDAIVWSRSAVTGDVTFDGEVDGVDLIRAARQSGRRAFDPAMANTVWSIDTTFDAHVDLVEDGVCDAADLGVVTDNFATLRSP